MRRLALNHSLTSGILHSTPLKEISSSKFRDHLTITEFLTYHLGIIPHNTRIDLLKVKTILIACQTSYFGSEAYLLDSN